MYGSGLAGGESTRETSRQFDKRFLIVGQLSGAGRRSLGNEDEVEATRQVMLRQAKSLAQQPLDARADDRAADFSRNAEAEARASDGVFDGVNKQTAVGRAQPFLEDFGEVA
jgi:hypothetical protein